MKRLAILTVLSTLIVAPGVALAQDDHSQHTGAASSAKTGHANPTTIVKRQCQTTFVMRPPLPRLPGWSPPGRPAALREQRKTARPPTCPLVPVDGAAAR